MGIEMGVKEKLACLAKVARKAPTEREILADAIRDAGGIVDVSIMGFTVYVDSGLLEVDFPGGLTGELYFHFAPSLELWDQADLAKGVLRNLTRHSYLEFDEAMRLFEKQCGGPVEDWLPERVADVGFAAIAEEIDAAVDICRRINSIERGTAKKISFDVESGILTCGKHSWRFQKRAHGSTWLALCAFAAENFRPHVRPDLRENQVRNACDYLNERTRPVLNWSATEDGILFCDIVAAD